MSNSTIANPIRLAADLFASRRTRLIQLALFAAAIPVFWVTSLYDVDFGGVSTVGAERVLRGEIPYRDFWTMYAPGHFYLLAGVFYVFGTNLVVEAIAAAVLSALGVALCYSLIRLMVGCSRLALVGTAVFGLALYNTGYFKRLSTYPPAVLLILAALYFLVLYFQGRKSSHLVWCGLSTGVLLLFKHDVGAYTAVAIGAGLMVDSLTHAVPGRPQKLRQATKPLVAYAFTAAAVAIPFLVYFVLTAGSQILEDLVIFPLTDFRFSRPEQYPSLLPVGIFDRSPVQFLNNLCTYLSFLFPFLMFVAGAIGIGMAWARKGSLHVALGSVFLVGFLLHYSAAHVQINTHFVTMSAYAAFLGALVLATSEGGLGGLRPVGRVVLLLLVSAWCTSLAAKPLYVLWQTSRIASATALPPKIAGFRVAPAEGQVLQELSAFVNANLGPDEKVYVGLHRHDVVIIGDVMTYFVLDRPPSTRHHELHPGITDTPGVQSTMIQELRTNDVRLLVLKRIFSDEHLDRVKADFQRHLSQVGASDLDVFISENYQAVREIGPYTVWVRAAVSRPLQP